MDRAVAEYLQQMEQFGRENDRMWNVPPETGRFLHILVRSLRAKNVVEIGSSNGYSGIWIGTALKATGGRLMTLEADQSKIDLALENFANTGLSEFITIVPGDALQTIPTLEGPFDFAFIDAAKAHYLEYMNLLEPRLSPGAMILADNASSHSDRMEAYLDYVSSAPMLRSVLVPIGSGVMMSLKIA